jgi:hypothetical protein
MEGEISQHARTLLREKVEVLRLENLLEGGDLAGQMLALRSALASSIRAHTEIVPPSPGSSSSPRVDTIRPYSATAALA